MSSSLRLFRSATTTTKVSPRLSVLNRSPIRPFHSTASRMVVHEVKSKAEFLDAINSHPKVVIDFHAVWCGPCKAISPILEKLSADASIAEKVYFIKIDVDEVPDVAQELAIRAMPTFVAFKDGEKVSDLVGAVPPKLTALVNELAA